MRVKLFAKIFVVSVLVSLLLPAYKVAALPAGFSRHLVEDGLSQPTSMAWRPGGIHLYVTEKDGDLRLIKSGSLISSPVCTFSVASNSERGLLGVVADPSFNTNRFLYVYYTRSASPIKNRVSRITLDSTLTSCVPSSEVVLLDDIPSDAGNHNAGGVHFAKSGKLMISTGDGGSTPANSQSLTNLAGRILRINKDGSIPLDNPFVGQGGGVREEIWAYGLRNPFTFAVHSSTGMVFINDVGQSTREEVNRGVAGGNYGWPTCEGSCSNPSFINPFYQYAHTVGQAITGGSFYRGNMFPSNYRDNYYFSDYLGGWIKTIDLKHKKVTNLHPRAAGPVDIDIGNSGALYYLSITKGAVYKIVY